VFLPFALVGIVNVARAPSHAPVVSRRQLALQRSRQKPPDSGWAAVETSRSSAALSSEEATRIALEKGSQRVRAAAAAVSSPVRGVVTAEALDAVLPKGAIVWLTFSNAAYLHFAQNFYLSCAAVGRAHQLAIAALDPPSLSSWAGLGVPVLNFSVFGDASDFRGIGADQARFRRMGAMKVAAFLSLLRRGRPVLCGDVDTVWLADPEPFLRSRAAAADIAVTSDCLSREADANKRGDSRRFDPKGVWFCGHNPQNLFGVTFNTGVLFLNPTPRTLTLAERWHAKLVAPTDDWHLEDQRAFNILVTEAFCPIHLQLMLTWPYSYSLVIDPRARPPTLSTYPTLG